MWKCSNCNEQHDEQFDTCWKCGFNPAGDRNPDFHVSEPVGDRDQTPDSPTDELQLPDLQLPAVTYFSIPPCIWTLRALMFYQLQYRAETHLHDFTLSTTETAVFAIAAVLIGIPVYFTMVRYLFQCMISSKPVLNSLVEFLWILSMFRLPASFVKMHRWFVPIYYGSLAAPFVAPVGFAAWGMMHTTRWLF